MKLKLETSENEKCILHFLISVFLCVANFTVLMFACDGIDKVIPTYLRFVTGATLGAVWALTSVAIFKYHLKDYE